jgi:hypothetical protein
LKKFPHMDYHVTGKPSQSGHKGHIANIGKSAVKHKTGAVGR